MSRLNVWEDRFQGLPALRVDNGRLRLVLLPDLGAKIAAWENGERGVSWLWTNPYLPWRRPEPGVGYVEAFDLGGWDECFPAVAPGVYPAGLWAGRTIPDHGEVWSRRWDLAAWREEGRLLVRGTVEGEAFPYRLERTLVLEPERPTVRLHYRLTNRSPETFYFLWAAHPLFPLLPGTRLLIPGPARGRVAAAIGIEPTAADFEWPWLPVRGGRLNVQEPDPEGGWALKVFLRPAAAWARLMRPEGTWWEIGWRGPLTHLGLWINAGGWSGAGAPPYRNLALEPCLGAPDDLSLAMREWGAFGLLPPHQEMGWSLMVTVG